MLNYFNEHFITAGHLFDSSNSDSAGTILNNEPAVLSHPSVDCPFNFEPVSVSEVCSMSKNLDPKKSAGPDGLEPFFLRLAADSIAEPLSCIFNLSLSTNTLPKVWKSAFVLPLLKGGEPSIVNNYRPISKLCILVKVFEKLVCDQLREFLALRNILNPLQSGFRKQHSTATAALKVFNALYEALDSKRLCVALFLDLSKAFDTVDHSLLSETLLKIGISKQATAWFANYLADRVQCVRMAGLSSTFLSVTKGVPQGSVLGPILFSIYINELCANLSNASSLCG